MTINNKLAIYIHWPFCVSKCPYCDFNSHVRDKVDHADWQQALIAELEFMHTRASGFTVSSIFFGGGTPSLMKPEMAAALINRTHQLWRVMDGIEITLEANPNSAEAGKFADFRAAGVNRLSLGVQSLRAEELKFLGRKHNVGEAVSAIKLARKIFPRYSFDLIYARPNQKLEDWNLELEEALELAGGHLSLYQLTIEENTAFHHAYANHKFKLPDEQLAEDFYLLTEEKMEDNGFSAYEVSNYARAGQESRHNLSYWLGDSYIGIGPGAHGRISIGKSRIAIQNIKSPERWLEQVREQNNGLEIWQELPKEVEIEERIMMGLRLKNGISYAEFYEQTGEDLRKFIKQQKQQFYIDQGLLVASDKRLQTTMQGRLVLNKLTAEILS